MSYQISKNTRLCISLAGRPRSTGTRFHNFLYAQLGLDYIYKACTTNDLASAIAGIRALGIRGCDVASPFKEACIPHLDRLDPSAQALGLVNTIVNDDGHLRGYNTDYLAIRKLLDQRGLSSLLSFALRGTGGIARAVAGALSDAGLQNGIIVARNRSAGPHLAAEHGYRWQPGLGEERPELLVNVTPIGMAGGLEAEDMPFAPALVDAAGAVMDMVAMPARTPLIRYAEAHGKLVITGAEVIALQAAEEFALCTGVRPSDEQIQRASKHARG